MECWNGPNAPPFYHSNCLGPSLLLVAASRQSAADFAGFGPKECGVLTRRRYSLKGTRPANSRTFHRPSAPAHSGTAQRPFVALSTTERRDLCKGKLLRACGIGVAHAPLTGRTRNTDSGLTEVAALPWTSRRSPMKRLETIRRAIPFRDAITLSCLILVTFFARASARAGLKTRHSAETTPPVSTPQSTDTDPAASRVRMLVQPKHGVGEDEAQAVFASLNAKQEDTIQQINVRI